MVRGQYFGWDAASEEFLKSLVEDEANLSWAQIAGRLSAAYGRLISEESCRATWKRLQASAPRVQAGGSLMLPRVFQSPPLWALKIIDAENLKRAETKKPPIMWMPPDASAEDADRALISLWSQYVGTIVDAAECSPSDAELAALAGPPSWFKKICIFVRFWRPHLSPRAPETAMDTNGSQSSKVSNILGVQEADPVG